MICFFVVYGIPCSKVYASGLLARKGGVSQSGVPFPLRGKAAAGVENLWKCVENVTCSPAGRAM
jgi:hypothetical protein